MTTVEEINKLIAELSEEERNKLYDDYYRMWWLISPKRRLEYFMFDIVKLCIDSGAETFEMSSELKKIGKTATLKFTLK